MRSNTDNSECFINAYYRDNIVYKALEKFEDPLTTKVWFHTKEFFAQGDLDGIIDVFKKDRLIQSPIKATRSTQRGEDGDWKYYIRIRDEIED